MLFKEISICQLKSSKMVIFHNKFIAGVNCVKEIPEFVTTNENSQVLGGGPH